MVDHTQTSNADDELLNQAAEEYFSAVARGESPAIDDFVRRYPSIGELIEQTFSALALIKQLGPTPSPNTSVGSHRTPERLGDFLILREIGRGGMGIVFEAEQQSMGRRVALKVLPFAAMLDSTRLARFKNEIRAAGTLDHENVVSIYSVGEDRGVHFYAMQLVRGQSLARVIEQLRSDKSRLGADSIGQAVTRSTETEALRTTIIDEKIRQSVAPEAERERQVSTASLRASRSSGRHEREFFRSVAKLGKQAALGLEHAHQRGVVHRDVKPANLLVDSHGHLTVTDFGLARVEAGADLTMTGDVLGTLRYMAPEQARGNHSEANHRADLYSLGVTLFELIAQVPAFASEDRRELLDQITRGEPTRLNKLVPSIPKDLDTILLKAIDREPSNRYQSARALADEFQRFLEDQPVRAKPPTVIDQTIKWSRRHSDLAWLSVVSMVMFTVAFAVAAAVGLRLYRDSEFHRERADQQLAEVDAARRLAESNRLALQQEVYSLDMKAAFDAREVGRFDIVSDLLKKYQPDGSRTDVRTFAWYVLQETTAQVPLLVMAGHEGAVREVALHPDGARLVTVGDDGTIRTWDRTSGALLTTIEASRESLNALAVSPDGQQVVTGSKTLQLWDLSRGEKIADISEHATTIEEVAISPDGRFVAAGSRDSVIKIVDVVTREVRQINVQSSNEAIAFTDDGSAITAICKRNDIHHVCSWDVESLELIRDVVPKNVPQSAVFAVSSNPNRFAINNGGNEWITLYDIDEQRELAATPLIEDSVHDLALMPDDSLLLGACDDGNLRLWQLDPKWTSENVRSIVKGVTRTIPAHQGRITSIEIANRDDIVTAGEDGLIKVWRLRKPRLHNLALRARFIKSMVSPDGRTILSCTNSGELEQCDSKTGQIAWNQPIAEELLPHIAIAADGTACATVDSANTAVVWNVTNRDRVASFPHSFDIMALALSTSGEFLAVTGVDGYAMVWEIASQRVVFEMKFSDWGLAASFSPQGHLLALGSKSRDLLLIDTRSWSLIHRINTASSIEFVAFDRAEKLLASGHRDQAVRVWDATTGELLHTLARSDGNRMRSLAFHPSGSTLAVGYHGCVIGLWHLPTGRFQGIVLKRSPFTKYEYAEQLSFSPDGRQLRAMFAKRYRLTRLLVTRETDYRFPGQSP